MGIVIDKNLCTSCGDCIDACPFGALEMAVDGAHVNAACKLCKICIKKCPSDAIFLETGNTPEIDKDASTGILVFAEVEDERLHPVTIELIGKAHLLAATRGENVYAVCICKNAQAVAEELCHYKLKQVLVFENDAFEYFRADVYANALSEAINKLRPNVVLIGATPIGRSLAPRTATRFNTGLTADCTFLEMRENGDLLQTRPAFGGNIMAQILTTRHRPQFATVRYKVMDAAKRQNEKSCVPTPVFLNHDMLSSAITPVSVAPIAKTSSITDAEVLVVAGSGVKQQQDISMLETLANALGGKLACTRPIIEQGWMHYTTQIGLSGRTVKPKLVITCGVSGAIQFTAGMQDAELIIAIDTNENAPIFQIAHHGYVGDMYEIIPALTAAITREVPK